MAIVPPFFLRVLCLGQLLLTCAVLGRDDPWGENLTPRLRVNYLSQKSDTVKSFLGNQTHNDHFKLLQNDGVSLLIGARNVVYNLSLHDLAENLNQRITWPSKERDRELCLVKGKSEDECQNYIRVLAQTDLSNLLVCGTNSFNPKCRTYSTKTKAASDGATPRSLDTTSQTDNEIDTNSLFKFRHEFSGKGFCPYDPRHNSTSIFADGELYSGTVADFSGSDALIIKDRIRTEQYNLKHLNAPDFVSSMEDDDHVYFFFRESAVEYINCGKAVYSRVARVCKSDRGGPHKFKNKWTTYLKTRLNCSVPGDMPFYFNEIQSTATSLISAKGSDVIADRLIYGVFTTPDNSIAGSAVCSFRLSDISRSFDDGPFKGQESSNDNWLPLRDVPSPRPGSCHTDSRQLSERSLNFIKGHSLMDRAVGNAAPAPLLVQTSLKERMTVLAVDSQVRTPGQDVYDVLFVGTTRGKIVKFVSGQTADDSKTTAKPIVIEEMQVFPYHVSVTNVQVIQNKLVVLSDHEVKSLPLNRCSAGQLQTCGACVSLQDPYCAWNVQTNACVDHRSGMTTAKADASSLVQSINTGRHAACDGSSSKQDNDQSYPAMDSSATSDANAGGQSADPAASTPAGADRNAPSAARSFLAASQPEEELDIVIDIKQNEVPQLVFTESRTVKAAAFSGQTTFLFSLLAAILAGVVGFVAGFFTSRRCNRDYTNCGHHYLERSLNMTNDTRVSESGYTAPPTHCNNALLPGGVNGVLGAPNGPSSSSAPSADTVDAAKNKNSNLLVNVPTKEDVTEKNVITAGGVNTAAVLNTTGTIGRNGTLCKKVYL